MKMVQNFVPTISLGGTTLGKDVGFFLKAGCPATIAFYGPLAKDGVPYQVPAGKTLKILAVRFTTEGSSTSVCYLGYGDNAPNSTSAPTNNVALVSGGSGYPYTFFIPGGNANRENLGQSTSYSIPAGKYPYLYNGISAAVMADFLCILE